MFEVNIIKPMLLTSLFCTFLKIFYVSVCCDIQLHLYEIKEKVPHYVKYFPFFLGVQKLRLL
jgi:hypothetical protein